MVKHGDFTRTIALDENSFSDRGTSIIKATNVKFFKLDIFKARETQDTPLKVLPRLPL